MRRQKKTSQVDRAIEILSDLNWHCYCDFGGAQTAKIFEMVRNLGYSMYVNENGTRFTAKFFCEKCGKKTDHRKLLSLDITEDTIITRFPISKTIKKRVLALYNNEDCFTGGSANLEIDHRITPSRINEIKFQSSNPSDDELIKKYMILTKVNNNIKREVCNKCIRTNFHRKNIIKTSPIEKYNGCEECWWAYPEKKKE